MVDLPITFFSDQIVDQKSLSPAAWVNFLGLSTYVQLGTLFLSLFLFLRPTPHSRPLGTGSSSFGVPVDGIRLAIEFRVLFLGKKT